MLTPAFSAIAFVLNPSKPFSSKMRAAASTITATVSAERFCRGGFLRFTAPVDVLFLTIGMRVPNMSKCSYSQFKENIDDHKHTNPGWSAGRPDRLHVGKNHAGVAGIHHRSAIRSLQKLHDPRSQEV